MPLNTLLINLLLYILKSPLGLVIKSLGTLKDKSSFEEQERINYHADHQGTAVVFETVSETVYNFRERKPVSASWSEKINKDYNGRK